MTAEDGIQLGRSVQISARQEFLAQRRKAASPQRGNLSSRCDACVDRDYQSLCPVGWNATRDGMCIASASYHGVCKKMQSFSGADKRESEILCEVCWPCKESVDACERNWDAPCPQGYSLKDIPFDEFADAPGSACVMDLGGDVLCEQEISFADHPSKMEFARRCDVSWPCKRQCGNDIFEGCPEEWTDIGDGLCVAPNNYKVSGCQLVQKFQGWSAQLKSAFAEKCKVVWFCGDHASHDDLEQDGPAVENRCEQVDVGIGSCPRFWKSREDGWCIPPIDLEGPCNAPKDLRGLTAQQKLLWASGCLLDWKCVGESGGGQAAGPRALNSPADAPAGPVTEYGYVIS